MKSIFTIDFADLTGNGIEPIIRVQIGNETVEDKLLKTLFQSTDTLKVAYYTPEKSEYETPVNSFLILSK